MSPKPTSFEKSTCLAIVERSAFAIVNWSAGKIDAYKLKANANSRWSRESFKGLPKILGLLLLLCIPGIRIAQQTEILKPCRANRLARENVGQHAHLRRTYSESWALCNGLPVVLAIPPHLRAYPAVTGHQAQSDPSIRCRYAADFLRVFLLFPHQDQKGLAFELVHQLDVISIAAIQDEPCLLAVERAVNRNRDLGSEVAFRRCRTQQQVPRRVRLAPQRACQRPHCQAVFVRLPRVRLLAKPFPAIAKPFSEVVLE